ncbi:MAG: thioredoxin domain-containing protein [Acidobacteria bacterium]|nr:thioredoxin domain-containing protein [Acidobacteriota bacterium]
MRKAYCIVLFVVAALASVARAADTDAACVGGKPIAPIKIEVFSDYQCPACRDFYLGTMRNVLLDYADAGKVCVIYREFPLNMHAHAREAAKYGASAMRMGPRYWAQVTDALYQNQDKWSSDGNIQAVVAGALTKADMTRLQKEMSNPATDATISSDIELGKKLEVNQTPTFFITAKGKTEKVAGVVQYPILRRYLDDKLK